MLQTNFTGLLDVPVPAFSVFLKTTSVKIFWNILNLVHPHLLSFTCSPMSLFSIHLPWHQHSLPSRSLLFCYCFSLIYTSVFRYHADSSKSKNLKFINQWWKHMISFCYSEWILVKKCITRFPSISMWDYEFTPNSTTILNFWNNSVHNIYFIYIPRSLLSRVWHTRPFIGIFNISSSTCHSSVLFSIYLPIYLYFFLQIKCLICPADV